MMHLPYEEKEHPNKLMDLSGDTLAGRPETRTRQEETTLRGRETRT